VPTKSWTVCGRNYTSLDDVRERVQQLDADHPGGRFSEAQREEWNELNAVLDEPENEARRRRILELAQKPANREEGTSYRPDDEAGGGVSATRSDALRANDRAEFLSTEVREFMERAIRQDDDPHDQLSRFVVATSDRAYLRAFASWMNDPLMGPQTWNDGERAAVRKVRDATRGMTIGTNSAGGFMVPYELDPNIIVAGTGYRDPMRAVARVETTAYNEKRFVTSVGVTTNWYAEEAEVSDNSPVLLQPTITCRKAMTFVPVSFELYEDSSIAQQIAALFADSKSAEEARVFTTGNGTTEPKGVITALVAAGGSAVIATGTNVLAQADLFANQASLPARWRNNARWMMNLSTMNGFRQLPKAAGLNESIIDDSGAKPRTLSWSIEENSAMDGTLSGAAADYLVLSGDFRQFAIVDRVGTTIEVVQNLFGANRRPTGQRGFLMHFRTGSDVLVPDAFRLSNYST
jgi:HK97 family phage major capsid protein